MNLIEGLQKEIDRRLETLKDYEAIGPAGTFGSIMLKSDIAHLKEVIASDDVVAMVKAYKHFSEQKIE